VVDVMSTLSSESHLVHVSKIRDPFNELCEDLAIEIHENILEELGWDEGTLLNAYVKLGTIGNVLVIERAELDNT
jgi:hypothetical protein